MRTITLPRADAPAGDIAELDLDPQTARLVLWAEDNALHPHAFDTHAGRWGVLFDDHGPRGLWGMFYIQPDTGHLITAAWSDDGRDHLVHGDPGMVRAALMAALSGGTVSA